MTKTPSPTLAARYAQGVKLRQKSGRQSHADLLGPADRDPVAILAAGDRTRIPRLIPVRYERMLTSPFAFLRGAAAVMAQDLRHQPSVGIARKACPSAPSRARTIRYRYEDENTASIARVRHVANDALPSSDFTVATTSWMPDLFSRSLSLVSRSLRPCDEMMFAWSTTLPVSGGKLKANATPMRQRTRVAAIQDIIPMRAVGEFAMTWHGPPQSERAPLNHRLWFPGFAPDMSIERSKVGLACSAPARLSRFIVCIDLRT